jgi:hypothetical protein
MSAAARLVVRELLRTPAPQGVLAKGFKTSAAPNKYHYVSVDCRVMGGLWGSWAGRAMAGKVVSRCSQVQAI